MSTKSKYLQPFLNRVFYSLSFCLVPFDQSSEYAREIARTRLNLLETYRWNGKFIAVWNEEHVRFKCMHHIVCRMKNDSFIFAHVHSESAYTHLLHKSLK